MIEDEVMKCDRVPSMIGVSLPYGHLGQYSPITGQYDQVSVWGLIMIVQLVSNIVLMNGVELHTDVSDLLITNLILIITINN